MPKGQSGTCLDRSENNSTGKSSSEALILSSTNPKYDDGLFTELWVQYMKTMSSELVVYRNWFWF